MVVSTAEMSYFSPVLRLHPPFRFPSSGNPVLLDPSSPGMEPPEIPHSATSFMNFPEDVQICILSFLFPSDIAAFSCTCRRFSSLRGNERLWFAMCDRRWGSKTLIRRWINDGSSFKHPDLYKVLDRWENLIGFWRRIGRGDEGTPPLVFFEWGPSFISGSRVSPSPDHGRYDVIKIPFLWMSLSPCGDPLSFVHSFHKPNSTDSLEKLASSSSSLDPDLIPVNVCFMGENHFVVDESRGRIDISGSCDDLSSLEASSPPEKFMAEMYQYFANRISPSKEKSMRKQRKKRWKDRTGRKRWESEHFVRISDCYPTEIRPLQGLWKGVCENKNLDFYLITYDEMGFIACRKVGDTSEPISGYSPILWTSNLPFLELPFSKEEEEIYDHREHLQSEGSLSRILCMRCVTDSSESCADRRNVEGRVWEYSKGKYGFGFLRNFHVIDLRYVAVSGRLLDIVEP